MPLPNFLIIGAAKAATTSLYHYLGAHPDVFMSPMREPKYFCHEEVPRRHPVVKTLQAYESLFNGAGSYRAVGEASPQYLNSVTAPDRIAEVLSQPKLIVSLRNPADRAYSSYLGRLRGGSEWCSVDKAMRPGSFYFESSLYYPRLKRYFDRFDRSQIKVVLFEEITANPHAVVQDIYEFLGVDSTFSSFEATRHNRAIVPRFVVLNRLLCETAERIRELLPASVPSLGIAERAQRLLLSEPRPLAENMRKRLLDQFREDIARTSTLTGLDLTRWLSGEMQ